MELRITGLPEALNGSAIQFGLFPTKTLEGDFTIGGDGTIQEGAIQAQLYSFPKEGSDDPILWTGGGSFYAAFMSEEDGIHNVTKSAVSFNANLTTIAFSAFEETQMPDRPPVDAEGNISGTIAFDGFTGTRPAVRISAEYSGYEWVDGDGRSYAVNDDGSFAIPFTQRFLDSLGSADQTLKFYLHVGSGNSQYRITLEESKPVKANDLSNGNINADSLGTVSLASITLSGTIAINDGGNPIPRVQINAMSNNSSIGGVSLRSPSSNTSWSITIAVQQAGKITFHVDGYDSSPGGGNPLFHKTFEPDVTNSVSNSDISGIVLDVGDTTVGKMSGTVSFSAMPSPAPSRISVMARYGTGNNWTWIGNGSYTVTVSGTAGTWAIPQDEAFLTALEGGDQTVTFSLSLQPVQDGNSFTLAEVERTVSKTALNSVDLGTVSLAYLTVSGTFSGTYNGSPIPSVHINVMNTETKTTIGSASASLRSPSSGAAWRLHLPAQQSQTDIVFQAQGMDSSSTIFYFSGLLPGTKLHNQDVPGVNIDIGDVAPNSLRVLNSPREVYNAAITTEYITATNYQTLTAAATGSANSSYVILSPSFEGSRSYNVMISSGGATRYRNSVYFYGTTGSLDWNDMTEIPAGLSAPTNLTATASGTGVSLSWDGVSGASYYRVYRNTSASGYYSYLSNSTTSATSYTDSDLSAGTYYYKVTATSIDGAIISPQSSYATATVSGGISAPTGLNATASGTSISLSWSGVSGASYYKVYRSGSASGSYASIASNVSGASYTDSGLSAAETYYYKVSAVSSSGNESDKSDYASATISASIGKSVSHNSVTLSWQSVSGAASFRIYRGNSEQGPYTSIANPSSLAYTDSGLSPGIYYYKVSVIASDGTEGPQSSAVSVTILGAPANLTATASGNNVSLSWSAVSGAEEYFVYVSTTEDGYVYLARTISTSYTDSDRPAGTYYYKVAAGTSTNTGPQSEFASATIGGGGGALAGAKGKLTLTGFNECNGKYVYSALITASGESLIGMNGAEFTGSEYAISMAPISGGSAEAPLYTTNVNGTTIADIYVPYEGSEGFQAVAIMIVSDGDSKFTSSDAASFAANYAAMISSNASNTDFTPATSGGNIAIARNDVMTMDEIMEAITGGGDYTVMQTVKYMLVVNTQ
jgi:fibronectin type 3 domain-containing protein